jgi:hypothetical protein
LNSFSKLFQIDHPRLWISSNIFGMKKAPALKSILAIRCPTCGAAPGQKCELSTGRPRTNPHLNRRLVAKD